MTIKLLLLKSGEDIISDIKEMVIGDKGEDEHEKNQKVVGYFLHKPCLIKMREPNILSEESSDEHKKASFQVSLYPWIPLSADKVIPVPSDWVVTIVQPTAKLTEMYVEDVIKYGEQADKDNISSESDSHNKPN